MSIYLPPLSKQTYIARVLTSIEAARRKADGWTEWKLGLLRGMLA